MRKPESLKFSILEPDPTPEHVEVALCVAVADALKRAKPPVGILLSGGVDSALLLHFVLDHQPVTVLTVAGTEEHPDLVAARRLSDEWCVTHRWWVPSNPDRQAASRHVQRRPAHYPGDEGVYLACRLAAEHGIKTLLATDGIDELMGGYWWHANTSERFGSQREAFEFYWRNLWPEHLEPLLQSARDCGLRVLFPYLDDRVVALLVRIPLEVRAPRGKPKAWWKHLAARHVPEWVIDRPKIGFVDALRR